jgi:hypothetical protein
VSRTKTTRMVVDIKVIGGWTSKPNPVQLVSPGSLASASMRLRCSEQALYASAFCLWVRRLIGSPV